MHYGFVGFVAFVASAYFAAAGGRTEAKPDGEAPALTLTGSLRAIDLQPYTSYALDAKGLWQMDTIEQQATFQQLPQGTYVLPSKQSIYWFKFRIHNADGRKRKWFLNNFAMDSPHFEAFVQRKNQLKSLGNWGYTTHIDHKPTISLQPHVPLQIGAGETVTVYLRVKFGRMAIARFDLYDKAHLAKARIFNDAIIFTHLAVLAALMLYNFFLYLKLRDRSYLCYIGFGFTMFVTVATISGIPDILSWNSPPFYWSQLAIPLMAFLPAPALIFNLSFLQVKERLPKTYPLISILIALQSITAVWIFFDPTAYSDKVINLSYLLCFAIVISTSLKVLRQGFRPAKYYLIAWSAFLASTIIWTLAQSNLIGFTLFTGQISSLGNAFEMILMSMALAERISTSEKKMAIAEAKAKDAESHRRLVRVLCHDVANPLAVIATSIRTLTSFNENPSLDRHITRIRRAAKAIEDLLANVRKIESNSGGRTPISLEAVSLGEMFEQTAFIFQSRLAEKNLSLSTRILSPSGDIFVLAEKTSLANDVLNNLVSNAIKFSENGSAISLIATPEDDGNICIKVVDHGIGMPSEILAKIFESDSNTSRPGTNREKGTGFGMPLVKSYVEQYGGKIIVLSKEEESATDHRGTEVQVFLSRAS